MMDWTDRHCRAFHRALSARALLYTEMVTAPAVLHGDRDHLLGFDAVEHPVALQLGGSDPEELAQAARIGEAYGYNEINLNVGCPSDRVQSGRFGACLMREPALVADCMAAIREAVSVPPRSNAGSASTTRTPRSACSPPWTPAPPSGSRYSSSMRARPGFRACRPRRTATCRPWTMDWCGG